MSLPPQVQEHYNQKRPKWPVPLTEGVPAGGGSPPQQAAEPEPKQETPEPEPVAEPVADEPAAEPVAEHTGGGDDTGSHGEFFHGAIKKDEANELLSADGGDEVKGKFLVRLKKAGETDNFILGVIYKGAPTHHALARGGDGEEFTLNKVSTGCTTIPEVLEKYRTKQPKWPVPLTEGVQGPGGGGAAKQAAPAATAATVAKIAEPVADDDGGDGDGDGDAGPHGEYFHGGIKKDEANDLLSADGGNDKKGKFLVRLKKAGETDNFILGVIYKGAPTHHALARGGDGEEFTLNKVSTGCTTIPEVLEKYRTKQPKWPVPLTEGVQGPGAGTAKTATKAAPKAAPAARPVAVEDDGDGEEEVDVVGPHGEYFHGGIKKDAANDLLSANGGNDKKGKFLVRLKKAGEVNNFILGVIYKGAPTHHALARSDEGEEFTLNKVGTGCTTISEVLEKYRTKQPKWPVPLTDGVKGPMQKQTVKKPKTKASHAAVEPTASAVGDAEDEYIEISEDVEVEVEVEVEIDDPMSVYYHGPIPKGKAEELLAADDGLEITGKFLIRKKGKDPELTKFIISVVYKGKPTHHALEREAEGEEFVLNKQKTGKMTIKEICDFLTKKRKEIKWPIALKDGVANGGNGKITTTQTRTETRKETKRVKAPSSGKSAQVAANDPRFKSEPKSNLTTTNADSGEFGFDDWDPHATSKIEGADPKQKGNPADQATGFVANPYASAPRIEGRVSKREVTKTWRRRRLSALEEKDRPNPFGDFGNLVSRDQLEKLQNIRKKALGKSKSLSTMNGQRVIDQGGIFAKAGNILSNTGFQLTGSSQNRMATSFMSFDMPAESLTVAAPETGGLMEECTFLGNCEFICTHFCSYTVLY